ncbi:E6 [Canis familiaris papillomavirus 19]|uniref:Protein E6 n=1 Tax=Canis familiaris papillomavirus 19 TaxID=2759773 RepID=A0A1C9J6P2_9PAPI|nr:E6 [Canis familiaris papillomavirus 19]
MAKPMRIGTLCEETGTTLPNILIPCVFCLQFLSEEEKRAFDRKILCLIWKGNRPYGICETCCRHKALLDCINNRDCCLEADGVLALFNKPLSALIVRCMYCLRPLTLEEKNLCTANGLPFMLVRRHWRNICPTCLAQY